MNSRRWMWWPAGLLLLCGVVGLYWWAISWAPHHLVNQKLATSKDVTPSELLAAQHNARFLMASIISGLLVTGGLIFTGVNYRLARRGQLSERFSKALERLDSGRTYVQIGGIHALEALMRDSSDLRGDVVEVLLAFVRENAPTAHPERHRPSRPSGPVQAALRALGQRPGRRRTVPLDLRGLHLQGAMLERAKLRGARLAGSNLRGAILIRADLRDADLVGTMLDDADLTRVRRSH